MNLPAVILLGNLRGFFFSAVRFQAYLSTR